MKFLIYLIKECVCIIFKSGYKETSLLRKSLRLYQATPVSLKKSPLKCIREVVMLFKYWNAFPDTYFRFGMFLKDYCDKEKMKTYIPQGAYYRISSDKNSRYHILIDDKIIFHDIMTYYGLPVPVRYFTFRNGEFRNTSKFITDAEVNRILDGITDDRIFVKNFTGGAASGISILTKKKGIFVDTDEEPINASTIRTKYANQDVFFEKLITQEPILKQFNPDTVNTIRVLTFKNRIISATVRFGRKGSFVDNISKGGVAVNIDIQTGMLSSYGMRKYDIKHYSEHPDSHLKFKGTYVTQWPEVKAIVEKTLKYLPYYQSVGFDVATTKTGPVIIEINTGAGINLSQIGREEGLRDCFKSI